MLYAINSYLNMQPCQVIYAYGSMHPYYNVNIGVIEADILNRSKMDLMTISDL